MEGWGWGYEWALSAAPLAGETKGHDSNTCELLSSCRFVSPGRDVTFQRSSRRCLTLLLMFKVLAWTPQTDLFLSCRIVLSVCCAVLIRKFKSVSQRNYTQTGAFVAAQQGMGITKNSADNISRSNISNKVN